MWKENGSPTEGPYALNMRRSRATFKTALKSCQKQEEQMKLESMIHNLRNLKIESFWIGHVKESLPDKIDESIGKEKILKLWEEKFSRTINSVNDSQSRRKLDSMTETTRKSDISQVKRSEVENFIK